MYVDIVSRGLAERKHNVIVITADKVQRQEVINGHLIHHRFKRPDSTASYMLGDKITLLKEYYRQVSGLIDQFDSPDVLEIPEYNAIGYYILQAKYLGEGKFQKIKIVVHCHTPHFELSRINRTPEYAFPMYWIGQMEKYCLNAADALLTQSTFLYNRIKEHVSTNKIFDIIPLPYNDDYPEIAYEAGKYLLYAGRLEYRKGIWQFLAVMARVWEEGETTPLVAIGGDVFFHAKNQTIGDMIHSKYKKYIDDGRLILRDKVPPKELVKLYIDAKAIVIPSIYENYPYTNVIAMSNGVPVFVSKQGGQAEAVGQDRVNGLIFDWDRKNDCYQKLKKLLSLSDEQLRVIGKNGYDRIHACCNLKYNIPLREKYYLKVLSEKTEYKSYPFLTKLERTALPDDCAQSIEEKGKLSIVIPYYNLGSTVEETINSIVNSSFEGKMEIILLDDGSTDESSIIKAREMEQKYGNKGLRLIHIENGGLANARNVGVKLATGEFICFLDADDMVKPTYFQQCVNILNRYNNVSFVYSWVQYFEGSNKIWTTFDTEFPYFCAQNQLTCMAVVRRKEYLAFGWNHVELEYGLEDYDGWLGMAENGRLGVCIPEPLLLYRVRANSMARSMSKEAIMYLRSRLIKFHPRLYKEYGEELYALLMQNGSNIYWESQLNVQMNDNESNALRAELEAIKNRRGYIMMDHVANFAYRFGFVRRLLKRRN